MKNRNDLYMMDKREAYSFIWECINKWCETYADSTNRIETCVETLINNYNDNNLLGERIEYCEYAYDGVNDGYCIGLLIEDESFVYPEFREEYNRVLEC